MQPAGGVLGQLNRLFRLSLQDSLKVRNTRSAIRNDAAAEINRSAPRRGIPPHHRGSTRAGRGVCFPKRPDVSWGQSRQTDEKVLRRISVLDLGARGAGLKGSEDSGRHKPDHKTHPINHAMNLIIPAMTMSYCHVSPNPQQTSADLHFKRLFHLGSATVLALFTHATNRPNAEQLRANGRAVGHMSLMSRITLAEGASRLLYSSRPGITAKLLLSIGAAGRPISPIWSKNPREDQRLKPHD